MSSTTEHLRERLSEELDHLGPIPDLAPAAARAGARVLRRRRLAAGSALGVAALGGGVFAAAQGGGSRPEDSALVDPTGTPSSAVSADPMADGTVTGGEWNETVRSTLESLLPARYGAVATSPPERNRAQQFTTSGGDPRLQMWVGVGGVDASDKSSWSCASQGRARPLLSCEEARLDGDWLAVATTELTGATADGGAPAYGTSLLFVNDGVFFQLSAAELGWDGLEPNGPAKLGAQELVDLASTPAFLEMVRVGVEWRLDQPEPTGSVVEVPDPVWPTPVT
jgi:hypothetical protein